MTLKWRMRYSLSRLYNFYIEYSNTIIKPGQLSKTYKNNAYIVFAQLLFKSITETF